MKRLTAALLASAFFALPAWAQSPQSPAPAPQKMPGKAAGEVVKVRGTISAIDKEKSTVTLKGPKGRTITLDVKDPSKFDVIKVGDPVIVAYVEAVAIQVKKAGSATPGVSTQESRVTSKPGETPAGAMAREVTVVGTITAIDKKAQTVTIKGPQGNQETVKVKDPKNLEGVKAGDMVELTFAQALAVSLDKQAPQPAKKP
jgi:Cu/Ag efflux protein CusF